MPARPSRPRLLLALGALFMPGCARTELDLFDTFSDADASGRGATSAGGGAESRGGRSGQGGDPAQAGDGAGALAAGAAPGAAGEASGGAPGAAGEASGAAPGAAGEASGGAAGAAGTGGEGATCQATPGDPGDVHWLNTYGDAGTSVPRALAVDSQGHVIVAGEFGKAIDFGDGDPLANPSANPPYYYNRSQSYLAKLDAQGNVLWAKAMISTEALIYGVALDPDDNIVIGGSFQGALDLDEDNPGAHVVSGSQAWCANSSCSVGNDVFVAKLTPAGEVLWGNAYGDDYFDSLYALACDSAGRIAFSGTFRGTIDFSSPNPLDGSGPSETTDQTLFSAGCDAFLAELDGDGNYLWSTRYGAGPPDSSCQRPSALAIAANDDVVLAGGYWGSVTLTGDAADELPKVNSQEVLLARFSSSGDLVFGHGWAFHSNQYATGVALADDGEILMVGYFGHEIPFDPDAHLVSAGSGDVFVARFDEQGAYLEGRAYGDGFDQKGTSIVVDAQGRITIGGRFSRSIDFGGSEPLVTTSDTYGDFDAFLVQLDSSLNAIWQISLGSTAADATWQLAKLCDGSPIAAGEYGAEAALSSGQTIPAHGGNDLWLLRAAP